MPTSWKPEVQIDGTGTWYGNGLRFATQDEAARNAFDLGLRWTAVRKHRAAESDEPVNYVYTDAGSLIPVKLAGEMAERPPSRSQDGGV